MLEHLPLADAIASAAARRLFPLVEREDLIQVAREALVPPPAAEQASLWPPSRTPVPADGLAPALSSLRPSCGRASAGIGPVAAPLSAPIVMATRSAVGISTSAESLFCRPEEDPFLLLESTLRSVQEILLRRRGLALRRTWSEQPYGEEEITLLEEEVIPAIQQCLARVDELDERLQAEQELFQACSMGSPSDALGKLMLQMA